MQPTRISEEEVGLTNNERGLWLAYRDNPSLFNRDALLNFYDDFCKSIARKNFFIRNAHDISMDDCQQMARLGLIEAFNNFDMDREIPFRGFAIWYVRGAIQRGIGSYSDNRRLESVQYELRRERSSALDNKKDDFNSLVDWILNMAIGIFLEDSADIDWYGNNFHESQSDYFFRIQIIRKIEKLPNNEKEIIIRHYFEGRSFVEISKDLKLSPARISQLHKKSLKNLMEFFEKDF